MDELDEHDGVLIVEDEVLLALDFEQQLYELGFRRIYLAHNLKAGREQLQSKRLKLAILDVNLGRDLIFPLAEDVRTRRIPIIFATALTLDDLPLEWRGHPVLSKPFDRAALQKVISRTAVGAERD